MKGSVVVAGVVRRRRQNTVGRSEGEGQLLGSRRGSKGSRIKKRQQVGEIGDGWSAPAPLPYEWIDRCCCLSGPVCDTLSVCLYVWIFPRGEK